MCGRAACALDPNAACKRFNVSKPPQGLDQGRAYHPTYNACPRSFQPIVYERGGERFLCFMQWGLHARFEHGPSPINARAETIASKPMFKRLVSRNRGILITQGFVHFPCF